MSENFDTIVVPAKPEKYSEFFQTRIVGYQTAPISKITDYVKVSNTDEGDGDPKKSKLNFQENSKKSIAINFDRNTDSILRRSRYTSLEKLLKAKTLKDLFD